MTRPGPLLKLPKERRTEIAKKAIKARWDKELDRRMKRLLAKLDEQTAAAQPRPPVLRSHAPVGKSGHTTE